MTEKKKPTIYRFADVVRATGTTPKSFRRWLVTLDYRAGDGWHDFLAVEVLQFGIMRQMVDWGVSVTRAAELAEEAVVLLWVGTDDPERLDRLAPTPEAAKAALEKGGLNGLSLRALAARMASHRLYILPSADGPFLALEAPQPWRPFAKKKPRVADYAGIAGAFLTIDVSLLLYAMAERLGEDIYDLAELEAGIQ